ncbi:hypothetical protein WAK64_21400 [Bacillus spongiae]|uniref:Uncharacterized protein n=1 Tax=Bacillus spongiae TaxID=2683610 RepID=A0ABU8HKK3_9BACI
MGNHLIKQKVLPTFFVSLLITVMGMLIGMMFIPPAIAMGE